MEINKDQYTGSLLGLALGDALGAPYEGGPIERGLWRLIGRTRQGERRWTDDTQMSLDLADSLIERAALDPEDVAQRFAQSYRWSRGYGPGAAKLLKRIRRGLPWEVANRSVFPDGSFGNGGAMRAPVVGLCFAAQPQICVQAARDSARITHAHPLGIEGAVLVATAVASALSADVPLQIFAAAAKHCETAAFKERLQLAKDWLASTDSPQPQEVAAQLGNGMAALDSCVTALYIGLRFQPLPFLEMLAFVAACGGDVDTIGAMAGALWGASNGAAKLPQEALGDLEQRARITATAEALWSVSRDLQPA